MNTTRLEVLKEKLEPFLIELARTHTSDDVVLIEYSCGSITFNFK